MSGGWKLMSRKREDVIKDNEMTEILTYHNISDMAMDRWATSPSFFKSEMEWLAKWGYRGISLKKFYENIEQEKTVVLTFDDGYKDFIDVAMPILDELNFSATVFIVFELIGNISQWRTEDLRPPLLSWNDIYKIIHKGCEIGSHGLYHRDFFQLSEEELEHEIAGSKKLIEEELEMPIISFSYPWDRCNEQILDIVKRAGYKYACIHNRKCKTDFKADPFRLCRKGMNNKISVKEFIGR